MGVESAAKLIRRYVRLAAPGEELKVQGHDVPGDLFRRRVARAMLKGWRSQPARERGKHRARLRATLERMEGR